MDSHCNNVLFIIKKIDWFILYDYFNTDQKSRDLEYKNCHINNTTKKINVGYSAFLP